VSRRDVLSDLKVERPEASDRDLTHLSATTQKILSAVEKLSRDLSEIPAPLFTQRLSALIDDLVSSLVPLMAAEDGVLCPDFDAHLANVLKKDHSEVRRLIERLSMLAEGLERRIPSFAKGPRCATLRQMTSALGDLHTHQLDALCHLDETLTIDEQARLSARLDAAAIDARERTMLIVRPEVPPTASTVLRHRPDLNAAYAMSLAEYDRRSHRDGAAAAEVKPS
jgi:Hemerythrin HHE cation binding domain